MPWALYGHFIAEKKFGANVSVIVQGELLILKLNPPTLSERSSARTAYKGGRLSAHGVIHLKQ